MWMWILPEELITGILSRLPVKSLLRFRCVSKAWFALIKDPTFINMHLHSNTERTLIMQTTMTRNLEDDRRLNLYYFLVNLSDEDQPVEVFPPFYDRHISSFPDEIVGCCNGLVCIRSYEHKRTVIWNPSIRKYKKLPSEPTLLAPRCRSYFAFRGKDFAFGYDPVNNDYKVLKIAQYFESQESNEFEVNVYSLKTHSWRRVEDEWPYKHLDVISSGPVYLNGAFRWLVKTQAGGIRLVTFNITAEKFQDQTLPVEVEPKSVRTLEVLRGSLCVSAYGPGERAIELWMMKESSCWSRLCALPLTFRQVVLSTDGQKVLMKMDHGFFYWYNIKNNTRSHAFMVIGPHPHGCNKVWTGTCVESLFLLDGDNVDLSWNCLGGA
jgi:F-box interacting protein